MTPRPTAEQGRYCSAGYQHAVECAGDPTNAQPTRRPLGQLPRPGDGGVSAGLVAAALHLYARTLA
ncbi:hypothetical protein [Actinomadura viridis]|uniref:Uncharacterized protein n=1 Tax=Actinomadura viridis TaxID=58110 RepID=A0A931D8S3_9ACTN|nr:hypothetical protein [Actinomadura viridis]MBG6086519.1 hypothetical protein [Actinomadura viridis]